MSPPGHPALPDPPLCRRKGSSKAAARSAQPCGRSPPWSGAEGPRPLGASADVVRDRHPFVPMGYGTLGSAACSGGPGAPPGSARVPTGAACPARPAITMPLRNPALQVSPAEAPRGRGTQGSGPVDRAFENSGRRAHRSTEEKPPNLMHPRYTAGEVTRPSSTPRGAGAPSAGGLRSLAIEVGAGGRQVCRRGAALGCGTAWRAPAPTGRGSRGPSRAPAQRAGPPSGPAGVRRHAGHRHRGVAAQLALQARDARASWFFGVPSTAGASTWGVYFTLAAVYGGLLLLMRVWWGMTRLYARCPGVPVKRMMWVFALWSTPDAGDRPAVQPGRLLVRRPGRDGQPPHEPVPVRALRAGQQLLHRPGRPAVGQRPGPVRSAVPPARRLLHPDHLPQRAGHHRPAPPAVAGSACC